MRNRADTDKLPYRARTWHGRAAAKELGDDAPRDAIYAAAQRLRRYLAAVEAGRIPGRNGRPVTSTHPRAAYFRERQRRLAIGRKAEKGIARD